MGNENEILRYVGGASGPALDGWVVVLDGDDYLPANGRVTVPISWPAGANIVGDAVYGDLAVSAGTGGGSISFKTGGVTRMAVEASRIITSLPFEVGEDPVAPLQVVTKQYLEDSTARGVVAYAQLIAAATLVNTTQTAIPGLSVTFTVVSGRRYTVKAKLSMQSTVTGDTVRYVLLANGGQIDLAQFAIGVGAGLFQGPVYLEKHYPAGIASGTHTFSVTGARQAGTGVCTLQAQSGIPVFIALIDEGPV